MDGTRRTVSGLRAPVSAGALTLLFLTVAPRHSVAAVATPLVGLASEVAFAAGNTLTTAITAGGTMSFNLVPGQYANGSTAATITTAWDLNPGAIGAVALYGYFTTPSAALTGSTTNIASSYVEGQMATGTPTAYTAFSQTGPIGAAGGSLLLFSEAISGPNKIKTRNDNLSLRINLTTGLLLPAGNYAGTLRIQARAL
jgi:hypothetical protein